jgi:hypothetical protein
MVKEFLLCGIGMAIDVSGSHYFHSQLTSFSPNDAIAADWKQVGGLLEFAIKSERPRIERESKQLSLKLDG